MRKSEVAFVEKLSKQHQRWMLLAHLQSRLFELHGFNSERLMSLTKDQIATELLAVNRKISEKRESQQNGKSQQSNADDPNNDHAGSKYL